MTKRKLFTRGEWLILLGLGMAVISAALTWRNQPPQVSSAVGAIYISTRDYSRAGFDLRVGFMRLGWIVVICAVISGALLLFEPSGRERPFFLVLQIVLAAIILVLAVLHIGPYPGVIIALLGGLLLLWGAVNRYSRQESTS